MDQSDEPGQVRPGMIVRSVNNSKPLLPGALLFYKRQEGQQLLPTPEAPIFITISGIHLRDKSTTMKKIILNLAITLDGFIEGPNGELDWLVNGTDFGDILTEITGPKNQLDECFLAFKTLFHF